MKTSIFHTTVGTLFLTLSISYSGIGHADTIKLVNPQNGHIYQRIDSPLNWFSAKDDCHIKGGKLAAITTEDIQIWMAAKNLFNTTENRVYVGGIYTSTGGFPFWIWLGFGAFVYSNWAIGEPNSLNGENTLVVYSDGTWNDVDGVLTTAPFICEWEPIRYLQTVALPDVNGNGSPEFASLAEIKWSDSYGHLQLWVVDGESKKILSKSATLIRTGYDSYTIKSLMVADLNSVPHVVILISNTVSEASELHYYHPLTGKLAKKLILPAKF